MLLKLLIHHFSLESFWTIVLCLLLVVDQRPVTTSVTLFSLVSFRFHLLFSISSSLSSPAFHFFFFFVRYLFLCSCPNLRNVALLVMVDLWLSDVCPRSGTRWRMTLSLVGLSNAFWNRAFLYYHPPEPLRSSCMGRMCVILWQGRSRSMGSTFVSRWLPTTSGLFGICSLFVRFREEVYYRYRLGTLLAEVRFRSEVPRIVAADLLALPEKLCRWYYVANCTY